MASIPKSPSGVAQRVASRLRFPQLFAVIAALFVLDLFIPDAIPFVDEILLGLLAALFGMWKQRRNTVEAPPVKNVTPQA